MSNFFESCKKLLFINGILIKFLTTKKNISGMLNSFVFLIDLSHEFAHNQLFGKKVL